MTSRWNTRRDMTKFPSSSGDDNTNTTTTHGSSSSNSTGSSHNLHSRDNRNHFSVSQQHRSSSQELMELEEQFFQQQQQQQQDEDVVDMRWNPSASSSLPSDDENIEDDDDDDDDDDSEDQAHLSSSMSDTDDSADSGHNDNNDGTCGVVDDALRQITQTKAPSVVVVVVADERKTFNNIHDHNNGFGPVIADDDDDDEYSPKRKTIQSKKRRFLLARFRRLARKREDTVPAVFDFEQYMLKREMNSTQEKWNAITVLPNPMYCLYYCLSAQWYYYYYYFNNSKNNHSLNTDLNYWFSMNDHDTTTTSYDDHGCYILPSIWHTMPVLPPLPVLAVVIGICVHAPWSFLYHWTYAHTMSATQRTKHWSRRMDQSFIHVASSFMCYGTSGSIQYFLVNTLYNLDCIRRQFRPTVRPKQNQMRIIISIIAYTLPLLKHGDYSTFLQLWVLFIISGYFFIHYPVGGWSHAVFHIVIALVPPLLLRTATMLPVSHTQLNHAAWCTAAAAAATTTATGSLR